MTGTLISGHNSSTGDVVFIEEFHCNCDNVLSVGDNHHVYDVWVWEIRASQC